jgi:hypothetical protein
MTDLKISSNDGLITATIKSREETYYLVTDSHLSEVKNNGGVSGLFIFLASIIWGAFFSVLISLKSGINMTTETVSILKTMQWIFLAFGIVFILLILYYLFLVNKSLKKIKSTGGVTLEPIIDSEIETIPPEETKVTSSENDLLILEALYGAKGTFLDLTPDLNKMIVDNQLKYSGTYNHINHDPLKNVPKTLTIKYRYKGKIYSKFYDKENIPINLPEL